MSSEIIEAKKCCVSSEMNQTPTNIIHLIIVQKIFNHIAIVLVQNTLTACSSAGVMHSCPRYLV